MERLKKRFRKKGGDLDKKVCQPLYKKVCVPAPVSDPSPALPQTSQLFSQPW